MNMPLDLPVDRVADDEETAATRAARVLWQFGTSHRKMERTHGPVVFESGFGAYLTDTDGNRYIDALSGVWVVNAGHGESRIVHAMAEQASRLGYALSEEGYGNSAALALAERLVAQTGGMMDRVYFTCGGSESVEMAVRMARVVQRLAKRPRKVKVIGRRGSYHGATLLALTLSDADIFSRTIGPRPEGVSRVAHPACYRCEFGATYPGCGVACAADLGRAIMAEGPDTVAAFIAEPISTSAGVAIPPQEYWEQIRRICDAHDVILICDEIVTGMGRTGRAWAMEDFGVEPDIVTMAKGLTSGYAPLGAVLTHRRITERVPDNAFLIPGYTFTGHPVSCAAALANIDIVTDPAVLAEVRRKGALMEEWLGEALRDCPNVGEVRVRGMLGCIDVVADPQTREPFPPEAGFADALTDLLLRRGVYLRVIGGFVQLGPPLTTPTDVLQELCGIVTAGIREVLDRMKTRN